MFLSLVVAPKDCVQLNITNLKTGQWMNTQHHFSIEELTADHPDWQEFVALINDVNQADWAFNPYFEQFSRYFLAAKQDGIIVGFLMFVVWDIGPHDRDHPPIQMHGKTLKEAKILAFGVKEGYRRQGIGRALQEYTIKQAKMLAATKSGPSAARITLKTTTSNSLWDLPSSLWNVIKSV